MPPLTFHLLRRTIILLLKIYWITFLSYIALIDVCNATAALRYTRIIGVFYFALLIGVDMIMEFYIYFPFSTDRGRPNFYRICRNIKRLEMEIEGASDWQHNTGSGGGRLVDEKRADTITEDMTRIEKYTVLKREQAKRIVQEMKARNILEESLFGLMKAYIRYGESSFKTLHKTSQDAEVAVLKSIESFWVWSEQREKLALANQAIGTLRESR